MSFPTICKGRNEKENFLSLLLFLRKMGKRLEESERFSFPMTKKLTTPETKRKK